MTTGENMCLPWKGSWGQERGEYSEKVTKGPSHLMSQVSQMHMWYMGVYLCGSMCINTRVFSSWKLFFQPLITIKTSNIEKSGWKLITILFSPYLDPEVPGENLSGKAWNLGIQCTQVLYSLAEAIERCIFITNYRLPAMFPEKWSTLLLPNSRSLMHASPLPTHLGLHLSCLVSTQHLPRPGGLLDEVSTRADGNLDKPSKRRKEKE